MSKKNGDDDLPDLRNWREIHSRYNYEDSTSIRDRIARKGLTATPEDVDIINAIALWKNNRVVHISNETIEYLNSVAKNVTDVPTALQSSDVADLLEMLLNTKGIALPLASTILKFYQPKVFPIIDQRAYRQVFGKKLPPNAGVSEHLGYLQKCAKISRKYGIPLDRVDEVLYHVQRQLEFPPDDN